ncbi:chorismate dehydratase [Evansella vedderi]|uniref:Chorismate dehydratase n=1 Tax=Evansella vedderi TaxID=38282 RepID=A0ABU0A1V8_9BACI|nr:menaquinone biosynthesis protein [Evansella vedderi]MDQ0257479.1 chorismate dehydratase [Evansella vedderi]
MSLVIGEISYTNILPVFYYLNRNKLISKGCEFVPRVPAKLNEGMADGTVHVGGISSFSYGEHVNEYVIFPDLSVSAYKEVGSIFLFSKVPITQLDGKSIALTSSSASSVNLLKIILKRYYELEVNYETMEPNFQTMLQKHDACLLIGDDAIMTSWNKKHEIHQYDLGALWEYFTGYPMTYAVFAVRKDACAKHPDLLEELYNQFSYSKQKSINNQFHEMIRTIQLQLGGSRSFWEQYFSGLNYDLTERHVEGLYHYFSLAHELNLLTKKVQRISLWHPTKHCHSV